MRWGGADSQGSAGRRALAPFQHAAYRECGRPEHIPRHRLTVVLLPVELCEMSGGIRPVLELTSTSGSAALGFTALLQPGLPAILNGGNGGLFFPSERWLLIKKLNLKNVLKRRKKEHKGCLGFCLLQQRAAAVKSAAKTALFQPQASLEQCAS